MDGYGHEFKVSSFFTIHYYFCIICGEYNDRVYAEYRIIISVT